VQLVVTKACKEGTTVKLNFENKGKQLITKTRIRVGDETQIIDLALSYLGTTTKTLTITNIPEKIEIFPVTEYEGEELTCSSFTQKITNCQEQIIPLDSDDSCISDDDCEGLMICLAGTCQVLPEPEPEPELECTVDSDCLTPEKELNQPYCKENNIWDKKETPVCEKETGICTIATQSYEDINCLSGQRVCNTETIKCQAPLCAFFDKTCPQTQTTKKCFDTTTIEETTISYTCNIFSCDATQTQIQTTCDEGYICLEEGATVQCVHEEISKGLVAHWDMAQVLDKVIYDAISKYSMRMNDPAQWKDSMISFNGISDYTQTDYIDNKGIILEDDMTISIKFKQDVSQESQKMFGVLFASGSTDGEIGIVILTRKGSSLVYAQIIDSSNWHLWSAYLDLTKSHTIIVRWEKEIEKLTIVVDGVMTSGNTHGRMLTPVKGPYIMLGKRPVYDPYFFAGSIDDLKLYNRALTDEELAELAKK